jgi:hypothetical protein
MVGSPFRTLELVKYDDSESSGEILLVSFLLFSCICAESSHCKGFPDHKRNISKSFIWCTYGALDHHIQYPLEVQ